MVPVLCLPGAYPVSLYTISLFCIPLDIPLDLSLDISLSTSPRHPLNIPLDLSLDIAQNLSLDSSWIPLTLL